VTLNTRSWSVSFENVPLKLLTPLQTQTLVNVVLRCEHEYKRFPSGHIDGIRLGRPESLLASGVGWWRRVLPAETRGFGDVRLSPAALPASARVRRTSVLHLLQSRSAPDGAPTGERCAADGDGLHGTRRLPDTRRPPFGGCAKRW
jgi:hypothetical protein